MALEKQEISLDLVQGGDTKKNPQIDSDYQDMVNVVFSGDMTAKKMKGYDLVASLPANEKYSLLARRQNDLIAQTDKGTYKYEPKFSNFKKISEIGSSEITSNECGGFAFAFGTNYRCFVGIKSEVASADGQEDFYFYDHSGVLVNKLTQSTVYVPPITIYERKKFYKVISNGDDFYICSVELSGTYLISILKFSINVTTKEFEYITSGGAVDCGGTMPLGVDFMCDGTYVFASYWHAVKREYIRRDLNLANELIVSMVTLPCSNIELKNKDATHLYATVGVTNGLNTDVKLIKIDKLTLTESLVTTLGTSSVSDARLVLSYPLTDTTAIWETFGPGVTGDTTFLPTGRMFLKNGEYYFPAMLFTTNNICTALMKYKDSKFYCEGISDTGQVNDSGNLVYFLFNANSCNPDATSYLSVNYYTSFNPALAPVLIGYNYDAKGINSYIEIEKSLIISNGIPTYFDGVNFVEYGFIGNPYITDYAVTTTGSLPADNGYQLAFLYSWTDDLGNIFYSPLGPIYSGGDPVNGITLAASSKITLNLQTPCITSKKDVTIQIYIKRKNKLFQLCYSNKIFITDSSINLGTYGVTISSYPLATAEIMPYQDGSIQPEILSNSSAISLYANRIFRISNDNPISLAYSQMKLAQNGFEFNDSFFYVDVLDKRGIAEDKLTGAIAMDGRLIIFKETSILYMVGSGPSRANTQDDFSDPQLVVSDVGCIQPRSIVLVPDGVMFKSDKGIYLLNRKLQAIYLGASVEKFNSYTIVSSILIESVNEIRFATLEGLVLVYNYFSNAWSWHTDLNCISSCIYGGKYSILRTDGSVIIENPNHNKLITAEIKQTISSPWLRLGKIQGYQKAYQVRIIGVYKSAHKLKMNVYYDYELYSSEEYLIDPLAESLYNISVKPTNSSLENGTKINGVYQFKIDLVRKNCQAVRVVIEDDAIDPNLNTGECFALSNINVTIGLKKGAAKIQASTSH